MNKDLHLEVLDLRFNNLADLVDDTNNSAHSIDVNNKISEVDTLNFNIGIGNEKLGYIRNENLIKYENQIYKIHGLRDIRDSGVEHTVECEHISINLTRVNFGQVEIPLETSDNLCRKILEKTGWVFIGSDIPQDEKKHLVTGMETSVYEALMQLAETFDAVIEFGFRDEDNKLTVFMRRGKLDRGLSFEYSFNLINAEANSSSSELITRLTMFGANNEITDEPINIASINNGKTYLEDYSFFTNQGYTIEEINSRPELFLRESMETDSTITDVHELKKVMEERLKTISQPQINANFTILNYANLKGFETEEPQLKERVIVYDLELKLEMEAIIIGVSKNSDNPLDINVEVSDVIVYNNRFGDVFNSQKVIDKVFDAQQKIHGIYIKEATIDTLHCKDAFITSAKIGTAQIDTAHIKKGAVGSIAIADAAIGNVHISDLNADKIKAGTISTANVKVASALGEIEITGYQVIINDTSDLANKYNRVILGKYKNNTEDETEPFKYGLLIRGTDGKTTMWDENGVHNAGITDGAIDNNKVSDNANINGAKLDINSIIHEVNTQEGLEKLEGMTIQIDNKSLEVIFKEIESLTNEHEVSINSHNTEIEQTKNDIRLLYESVSQLQSGELVGTIITSTNGNIFNGENKETSLVLQAFNGTKEITDTIDDTRVIWSRNSGNPSLDEIWNKLNKTGKIIKLTANDILNRSTFTSKLLSKKVDGQEQGVISISQITLLDYSDTIVSDIAPTKPSLNLLWIDTSIAPNQMKRWNGAKWEIINDTSDLETELGNISNEIYAPEGGLLSAMEWVKNEIKITQEGIKLKADKTEINSLYNRKYKVRYIREYINGNTVNLENHWVEFKAFSKGLNILQNRIPRIINGANPVNLPYITDNIYNNKTKFATISGSNVCIEFDLEKVYEDIEFIHIWHYYADNRSYKGNKIQVSEDGIKWIILQDNTNNRYIETSQGNIIPVSLGSVVENYGSRIKDAEISLTPESISQTVRNSMVSDFANSSNLIDKSAKFVKERWTTSAFKFDEVLQNTSLNLKTNSLGEINSLLEEPVKLEINSYYCMSFQFTQKLELFNHKVDFEIVLNGDGINKTHRINNVSIDNIKQAKTLYLQYLSSDKIEILKGISIKIYRKEEVATDTFVVLECPQFEKGAFPSKWTYPYELAQHDEYSYREQTAKKISEKVGSGDFESYKEQTDKLISQKVTSTETVSLINKEIEEYNKNIEIEFKETKKSIEDIENLSNNIFADNVISVAEKETLKKQKTILEKEHKDIISQVVALEKLVELKNTKELENLLLKKEETVGSYNNVVKEIDKIVETKYTKSNIVVNPTTYEFSPSEKITIKHNAIGITYGYLYGLDGVINSESYTSNTITFPSYTIKGEYNCHLGTYIGNDWTQSNDFTITIKDKDVVPPPVEVSSITLNKNSITMYERESETLIPTITPDNATNKSIVWSSSNSEIATVKNGIITGVKKGAAEITATTINGKEAMCTVNVESEPPTVVEVSSITISKTSINKKVGESEVLTFEILPSNATDKSVIWSSSDNSIASVENGLVKALKQGVCDISITSSNNIVARCSVTVEEIIPPPTQDSLNGAINNYSKKIEELRNVMQICSDLIAEVKINKVDKKLGDKISSIEQTAESIIQTVKTDYSTKKETTDKIDKAISDYKIIVDKEFGDINTAHDSLENTMNTSFKDGIVSEAEAKAINERLVALEKEKLDIDKEYNVIYPNSSLNDSTEKINLSNTKNAYNTAYTNLKNSIINGIVDGKVISSEITDINNKTNVYKSASANYKEAFTKSVDKIGSVKVDVVNKKTDDVSEKLTEQIQTNEEFQFKVINRGVNNYLKNSDFLVYGNVVNQWGFEEFEVKNWEIHGYHTDSGMNKSQLGILEYSSEWAYKSKTENTLQIKDFQDSGLILDDAEMGVKSRIETISGKKYTLTFLTAAHRVNKLGVSIKQSTNNEVIQTKIYQSFPSGGADIKNWMKVQMTFEAKSEFTDIYIYILGITEKDPFLWIVQPMVSKGELPIEYTSSNKELNIGITSIDNDGMKISMSDGDGIQGYTRVNYEGLSTYDKNNNRKAWFGEGDSAYIEKLSVDEISNRHILKWGQKRPSNFYISSTSSGDGTGRDSNNKSNSINHTLNWIWNTYGCYSWKQDLNIHVSSGTYTEDIYIGGWIGSGNIIIDIDPNATIYGCHRIEENTMSVTIQGRPDFNTWSDSGATFVYRGSALVNDQVFCVRRSNAIIRGCRSVKEGYNSGYNNWSGYTNKFVCSMEGSQTYVYNCVICGFYYSAAAHYGSMIAMHQNRGHTDTVMYVSSGSIGTISGYLPVHRNRYSRIEASIVDESCGLKEQHNSNCHPKQEKPADPPPPPPPPPPAYIWVEGSFTASNLRTYTEGSGSGTSNRNGMWGQGYWGSYKAHRGYADLGNNPSSWCSGGRNFTGWITLRRITSGGYNGEVPVPHIKRPDGSFWNSGVAFAHAQTKTIQLPSDITNAIANGSMKTLEMWAGRSQTHYAFFDYTTIKIKCEKPT